MRTRMLLAHLFAGFVVVAAIGCGGGGTGPQATSTGAPATATQRPARKPFDLTSPVTIDFWHSMGGANATALEALVKDFQAREPNIHVNLVYQGGYTDSFNKLVAVGMNSKDAPAVIQLEDVLTQTMTDSKKTVPMQDFVDRDRFDLGKFVPQARDYYTVDGLLRSMPFNVSSPILYYNANAFRAAGLDPANPPTDFDQLARACEKLMVRKGDQVTRHCIATDITSWYFEQFLAKQGALYVNHANGRDGRADAVAFNSPEGLKVMRWWQEGVKSGLILNVGRNPAGPDALLALVNPDGGAAIALQSSANLRSVVDFLEANKGLNIDPATAPLPSPTPGGKGIVLGGASLWIPATGDTPREEAAWKLVSFLSSAEVQAKWHATSGYLPVRFDSLDLQPVQDLYKKYPQFRLLVDEIRQSPNTRATQGALMGPSQQVRDALVSAIEEMLLRGTSPEQALKQAESQANEAIKRYNRAVE